MGSEPDSGFVFCENNDLVRSTLAEIRQHPGEISPILFYGPTGCGKTLLLQTIKDNFHPVRTRRRSVNMSAEQFTSAYLAALNGKGLPMFRRHYRDLDLFLIDDIQFFRGKKATTTEFQHTIDCLMRDGKQIVLTADRPPVEMEFLSPELVTRLSGGLICPVRFPNRDARIRIARRIASKRQLELSDDLIELLADRFPRDVRRISGAINRLRLADTGQPLDLNRAEEYLADLVPLDDSSWSIRQIESAVTQIAGVTATELRSGCRTKKVCTARMLAMWLSRQYTRSAFSEIGAHFGGRTHSTVIAATQKVDELIKSDQRITIAQSECRIRDLVDRVGRQIREVG